MPSLPADRAYRAGPSAAHMRPVPGPIRRECVRLQPAAARTCCVALPALCFSLHTTGSLASPLPVHSGVNSAGVLPQGAVTNHRNSDMELKLLPGHSDPVAYTCPPGFAAPPVLRLC